MVSFNLRISKLNIIAYGLFLCIFSTACILYYLNFVDGYGFVYEPFPGWINPVNIHDHYVYLDYINEIHDIRELFGLNNNLGIALVYYNLHLILDLFDFETNYEVLSLFVNLIVLFFTLSTYIKLIEALKLPKYYIFSFFFLTSLIYFSQLINKDSFTILIILKAILYSKNKAWKAYFILMVLSVLIRFQLPALLLLYSYIVVSSYGHIKKMIFIYIFLSLLNGYLAKYQTQFFNESTLSDGISYTIYQLNLNYYIGSLLFNPIRVIQYFYDVFLSFDFINSNLSVDVSRLKNIPQIMTMAILLPFGFKSILKLKRSMMEDEKYQIAMLFVFFMIWLFNPTINQRYFICFLPVLQILCLQSFYQLRKNSQ